MEIISKKENENVGFHYSVTDEQINAFQKLSVEERILWVETNTKFIYAMQTPKERDRMKKARNFNGNV